jgi:hypothetical protein
LIYFRNQQLIAIILKRETGSLEVKKQGRGGDSNVVDHHAWVDQRKKAIKRGTL